MKYSLLLSLGLALVACGDDDGLADAGSRDVGGEDATAEDATAEDAGGEDATAEDGGGEDAGEADASPPEDAGAGDAATGGECTMDSDCRLFTDCCSCMAVRADEEVAECPALCVVPLCQQGGIEAVECRAGECVLSDVECDDRAVTCDGPVPACEDGELPQVVDACYTGLCIPVTSCRTVRTCEDCGADQTCITIQTMLGPQYTCAPLPDACDGTASCECVGDDVCEDPFTCIEGEPLTCSCLVC